MSHCPKSKITPVIVPMLPRHWSDFCESPLKTLAKIMTKGSMSAKSMILVQTGRRGQGLLETTIAISVLITGIVAVMGLTYSNASSTGKSSNRIIASNLAREAIEAVHFKRDTNWIQGLSYNTGLNSGADYSFTSLLDPSTGAWTFYFAPNLVSDPDSKVYSKTGLYLQTNTGSPPAGGATTNFRRIVVANLICRRINNGVITIRTSGFVCVPSGGAQETEIGRQIIATVDWPDKSARQSFIAEDRIYDWR